ncbi:MAG: response regulator with CheY-like receiver, AAA-type ATPase, and DNA-binding domain [Proteobacteria bacterium]|nr:response regulator with CheY-like receiver, AAA-type ATPase, and DNA-binding domain [Pseudomonadota bacterium]
MFGPLEVVMKRLLLVDDEINLLHALKRLLNRSLQGKDVVVEIFDDPEAALQRAGQVPFDVVVSDYRMPTMDGVTFLRCFRGIQPDTPRLILSAATDFEALVTAVNEVGIYRYLSKPWSDEDFVATIEAACREYERHMEEHLLAEGARRSGVDASAEALEKLRIEAEEPGITHVNWAPDGSVILGDSQN